MVDELSARRMKKCAEGWRGHDWMVAFNIKTCKRCGLTIRTEK